MGRFQGVVPIQCVGVKLVFEIVEFVSDLVDYGLAFAHSLVIPVAAGAVTEPEMRGDGAMGRLIFAPGVENGFCKLVGVFMRHRSITPMPFVSFIIEVGYDALYECCNALGFEEGFWFVEHKIGRAAWREKG